MRTIRRSTGIFVVSAMVAAVMFLSVPGGTMWRKVLQDFGHGPVFFVIGVALALMQEPRNGAGTRSFPILCKAFAIAVAIGVATEMLQHFQPGRSVSPMDVLHDAAGAALGLAVLAIVQSRRPSPGLRPASPAGAGEVQRPSPASARERVPEGRERVPEWRARTPAFAVALASLTLLAWQPIVCAVAYAQRRADYPVLAEGAHRADLYFLRGNPGPITRQWLPERFRRPGDGLALRVGYVAGESPRFEVFEPSPDWRGHSILAIDLTNPGTEPLTLVLRVHDERHDWQVRDRLNLPLDLPADARISVRVALPAIEAAPRTRPMDLSRIAGLMLFARGPAAGSEFYVSRIWLE